MPENYQQAAIAWAKRSVEYGAKIEKLETENKHLRSVLKAAQFDVRGRCPLCFGWDGESEQDGKHSANCIIASALTEPM